MQFDVKLLQNLARKLQNNILSKMTSYMNIPYDVYEESKSN